MGKIMRRVLIVVPAVALQVLWHVLLVKWLAPYAPLIVSLLSVAAVFMVLFIVIKRDESTYKLLWLLIILTMPLVGTLLYLFFGNKRTAKPLKKRLQGVESSGDPHPLPTGETPFAGEKRMEQTIRWLERKTGYPLCKARPTRYYPLGDDMFPDMLRDMKSAKRSIYIEYFIIEPGQMWDAMLEVLEDKLRQGVDVRVMYDDLGSISSFNFSNARELTQKGIPCVPFNPLLALKGTANYRDHREMLIVDNEMGADGTIYGTLVSKKKGKQDVVISNIAIPIVGSTVNNICINRTGEAREGYVVVKEPRLSEAIERVPDEVLFDATAKANSEKVVKFDLGRNYKVKPSYRIEAPLAFAENAEIVYKDTLDEWNDDLQDYELAENTYLSATANVANGVPVFLSVDVVPVDVDKKEVKGVKVELLKKNIAASANGTDKVVSPLEMKITQTEKGALKKLDGLILTATGKAKEGDKTVTGITLNAEKHTLKITDIRIKIVGKVIGDFN